MRPCKKLASSLQTTWPKLRKTMRSRSLTSRKMRGMYSEDATKDHVEELLDMGQERCVRMRLKTPP